MSYRILMLEQDETLANLLRYSFITKGNSVVLCQSDDEVIRITATQIFDIIVLDSTCPGLKGLNALAQLRKRGNRTPVILLSGWSQEEDIVRALSLGAEDVIRKPFGYEELLARMNAILRRINENVMYPVSTNQQDEMFRFGFLDVFPRRLEVYFHDDCIAFRREEFNLMFHFLKNPGTVFTADQLRDVVYDRSRGKPIRIVHFISAIRKKIQIAEPYIKIQTIPSVGYKLTLSNQNFFADNIIK